MPRRYGRRYLYRRRLGGYNVTAALALIRTACISSAQGGRFACLCWNLHRIVELRDHHGNTARMYGQQVAARQGVTVHVRRACMRAWAIADLGFWLCALCLLFSVALLPHPDCALYLQGQGMFGAWSFPPNRCVIQLVTLCIVPGASDSCKRHWQLLHLCRMGPRVASYEDSDHDTGILHHRMFSAHADETAVATSLYVYHVHQASPVMCDDAIC